LGYLGGAYPDIIKPFLNFPHLELMTNMQDKIDDIKKKLDALEILIRETRARLPAHSTKPPVMMELLDLEDEYDVLLGKLNELKEK
jgi:hypothetical protein